MTSTCFATRQHWVLRIKIHRREAYNAREAVFEPRQLRGAWTRQPSGCLLLGHVTGCAFCACRALLGFVAGLACFVRDASFRWPKNGSAINESPWSSTSERKSGMKLACASAAIWWSTTILILAGLCVPIARSVGGQRLSGRVRQRGRTRVRGSWWRGRGRPCLGGLVPLTAQAICAAK